MFLPKTVGPPLAYHGTAAFPRHPSVSRSITSRKILEIREISIEWKALCSAESGTEIKYTRHHTMKKTALLLLTVMAAGLALSACSSNKNTPPPAPMPSGGYHSGK